MKKALVLMFLLGILTVLSTINASATLVGYWDFEEGTGSNVANQINPLMNGTYVNENTNTWVQGKIGSYAVNVSHPLSQAVTILSAQGLLANDSTTLSLSIWIKPRTLDNTGTQTYVESIRGNNGTYLYHGSDTNNIISLFRNQTSPITGVDLRQNITGVSSEQWCYIVQVVNATHISLYFNGVLNSTIPSLNYVYRQSIDAWALGATNPGSSLVFFANATFDEFAIFNHTLTQTEINNLWNNSYGARATYYNYTTSAETLSINWTYPSNNTQFNTAVLNLNFSVNASNVTNVMPVNCTIYQNEVVNTTVIGIGNANPNIVSLNYAVDTQGEFNYSIYCVGVGLVSAITSNRTVFVDNVNPLIVSNFVNFSAVLLSNLTGQFNFSDSYLYGYNISIDDVTIENKSNMVATFYSYNLSRSNFTTGVHKLSVRVIDGHTAASISNYAWSRDKDMALVYSFGDGWVKVLPKYGKSFPSWIDTVKSNDRYSFVYDRSPLEKASYGEDLFFRVTSSSPITISARTDYPGWLVIDGLNKWIDFNTVSKVSGYDVIRVNDNTVDITIKGVKENSITFNSIGELNVVEQNYSFYQGNYTYSWVTPVLEQSSNAFSMNFTINSSYITDVNANITYNSVVYNPTKSSYPTSIFFTKSITAPDVAVETNVSFNWTYAITGLTSYGATTGNASQQVFTMGLTNCSATDPFMIYNISIYDETNLTLLPSSMKMIFDFWTTPTNKSNVTFDVSGFSNYYICRDSNYSFYADAYLLNTVNFTHRYYLVNSTVTPGSFENIYLYNFQEAAGITDLRGTIRYATSYNYYPNVIAKLQRFYPALNVWKTVQMDESGDFGLVHFNIIEENVDYKLLFMDRNNNLLKTTESLKFGCTSGLCELTFLVDPYEATAVTTNTSVVWSFDNNTRMIYVNWTELMGDTTTVDTLAVKQTMTGTVSICDSSQTGSSGSVSCNASAYSGEIYLTVDEGTTSKLATWVSLPSTKLFNLVDLAEAALWTFGIMLTVIMFGTFSPFGAVLAGIVGLIFLFYLGLFSPLTITFLIVAIALGIVIGIRVRS